MSAYIPFEIQVEVIKRVIVVKSLILFRSVSKQWKSLIDSYEFITDHSVNQTLTHHLLLKLKVDHEFKYVSIVDDDSFHHHKFPHIVSPSGKLVRGARILDSSHGLVGLYGFYRLFDKKVIVLWNPTIRKSVGIVLPNEFYDVVGFGVCPKTSDPKIVKVTHTVNWKAEVLTLSTGAWRSIPIKLWMPIKSFISSSNQVVIDGVIHWAVYYISGIEINNCRIISFDLTREEFGELDLPNCLANPGVSSLSISKLKESLVALVHNQFANFCDVWIMIKSGDLKPSFTKLFTVSFQALDDSLYYRIVGFRKNGKPITQHISSYKAHDLRKNGISRFQLSTHRIVYQPCNDLGTYEAYDSHFVMNNQESHIELTSYTESLLLLNYSDAISGDGSRKSSSFLF